MKKILSTFVLLLSVLVVKAQELPINDATEKVTFMEVVDATGLSANDIYTTMKTWAKSNGLKITEDKADEKEFVTTGILPAPYERAKGRTEVSNVNYKFYFYAKEGKYRFIATDFVHEGSDKTMSGGELENEAPECGPSVSNGNWNLIKKKTKNGMDELIEDLKKKIKVAQNDPTKNSDW
ncbi:DUF4468 domain-containing protein [Cytophagaceae bacterium ABcell3]|nr:DUF4468 domain-containing protein [Cytophagaceae bacterium ABcell3]